MSPRHIIVIGSARSGTKLVRDSLSAATGAGRVPYDISYVWRYGNEGAPDDVLSPEQMSEKTRRFIRRFVDRYAAGDPPAVVEKTVGNALRVPAVAAVFPEALFVHVIRDGVDVIESTRRQWSAGSDLRYLARKVRHFPLRLAPRYGVKYLRSQATRRVGATRGRVATWGVRYPGIDEDLLHHDLLVVCARQWRNSVEEANRSLDHLRPKVIEVRYEDLTREPVETLRELAAFARLPASPAALATAAAGIVQDPTGRGRRSLSAIETRQVEAEVGRLLQDLGYGVPSAAEPTTHEKQGPGHE